MLHHPSWLILVRPSVESFAVLSQILKEKMYIGQKKD
jgi:hypothetical protein